jgi:hypothetical protein
MNNAERSNTAFTLIGLVTSCLHDVSVPLFSHHSPFLEDDKIDSKYYPSPPHLTILISTEHDAPTAINSVAPWLRSVTSGALWPCCSSGMLWSDAQPHSSLRPSLPAILKTSGTPPNFVDWFLDIDFQPPSQKLFESNVSSPPSKS